MNVRARLSPEETADRILAVAEEHFRRVGYGKTAVADIAQELGMSSANVYRFFPSKAAINEAICRRLLEESHRMMAAEVAGPGSAGERLRRVLIGLHLFNKSRYVSERRIHEMVSVAMEENWGVVQAHLAHVVQTIAGLIAEGVATGEFKPVADVGRAAFLVKRACSCILHPLMIVECIRWGMDHDGQAAEVADFAISALKA